MLTLGEAAGLNLKGLNPQLKANIGRLADNRPVILARAVGDLYECRRRPNDHHVFRVPFSLSPGDMIRVKLYGTGLNNTGAATSVWRNRSGGPRLNDRAARRRDCQRPDECRAVRLDGELLFSINVPGAKGNYVPNINVGAVTTGGTYSSGNQALTGIGFTGGGSVLVSDTSSTGPIFAGGKIVPTAGVNGAAIGSRITPITLDPSLPIELDILLVDVSGARSISVNAGVMEGL